MKTPLPLSQKADKLQYIDCLRGIAILMVICNHADKYIPGLNTYVQIFSDYSQMGVQLFFVVSSYTLCLSMERRTGGSENLQTFYVRRYFRIAPLYYAGIPLYLIYFSVVVPLIEGGVPAVSDRYSLSTIMANILLVNDFVPGEANNRVVPGGWSIGTETSFYLIFPFLYLWYKRFRNNNTALLLIPFSGLAFSVLAINGLQFLATEVVDYDNFLYFKQNNKFLYFNLLCQLPVFLTGMSLYFAASNYRGAAARDKIWLLLCFAGFTAIALYIYLYHENLISLLPFVPAVSFFFLFLLFREVPFLSNRLLARIGQLSFSIYLFHFIFAFEGSRFLYQHLGSYISAEAIFAINIVLSTAVTAGVALLSERFIEQPGIEIGKRIIRKIKAKSTEPALVMAREEGA